VQAGIICYVPRWGLADFENFCCSFQKRKSRPRVGRISGGRLSATGDVWMDRTRRKRIKMFISVYKVNYRSKKMYGTNGESTACCDKFLTPAIKRRMTWQLPSWSSTSSAVALVSCRLFPSFHIRRALVEVVSRPLLFLGRYPRIAVADVRYVFSMPGTFPLSPSLSFMSHFTLFRARRC